MTKRNNSKNHVLCCRIIPYHANVQKRGLFMSTIPVIAPTKNYWLVRTNGGRYYKEFKSQGFIGINWEELSIEDIKSLDHDELTDKIKEAYPEKSGPYRTAAQLKTFVNLIKKGDTVVITGPASNVFSIGEVLDSEPYSEEIPPEAEEEGSKICPYSKRKKVRWIKELQKLEMEMKFFQLLQHAQNTISDASEYADLIEGLIHDFFIRGEHAQVSIRVTKEDSIPMPSFFLMGAELIDLLHEFNRFSKDIQIDVDSIETQINVNSPGKIKFSGVAKTILVVGLIFVGVSGGKFSAEIPVVGGSVDLEMPSVVKTVSEFLDDHQQRQHKELLLTEYMKDLQIETPEELEVLLENVSKSEAQEKTSSQNSTSENK